MNINTLKTGDLIIRQKGPLSTHYLVWIGWIKGIPTVAENLAGVGVRYASLQAALAGNAIKRFEEFGGREDQRSMVIPKINVLLGKRYDLVVFNCEHFARWVATGKMESTQIKNVCNIAISSGLFMLASNNKKTQGIGLLSIAAGLLGYASQSSYVK